MPLTFSVRCPDSLQLRIFNFLVRSTKLKIKSDRAPDSNL